MKGFLAMLFASFAFGTIAVLPFAAPMAFEVLLVKVLTGCLSGVLACFFKLSQLLDNQAKGDK